MYDYMRALEDRFNSRPSYEQRQQLEAMRQEVSAQLDKEGRKKLLRLVDAHTLAQEDVSLVSSIAGFRPAWAFEMEREQVEATPAFKNSFRKRRKLPW